MVEESAPERGGSDRTTPTEASQDEVDAAVRSVESRDSDSAEFLIGS